MYMERMSEYRRITGDGAHVAADHEGETMSMPTTSRDVGWGLLDATDPGWG